jgi:hypothetical protein
VSPAKKKAKPAARKRAAPSAARTATVDDVLLRVAELARDAPFGRDPGGAEASLAELLAFRGYLDAVPAAAPAAARRRAVALANAAVAAADDAGFAPLAHEARLTASASSVDDRAVILGLLGVRDDAAFAEAQALLASATAPRAAARGLVRAKLARGDVDGAAQLLKLPLGEHAGVLVAKFDDATFVARTAAGLASRGAVKAAFDLALTDHVAMNAVVDVLAKNNQLASLLDVMEAAESVGGLARSIGDRICAHANRAVAERIAALATKTARHDADRVASLEWRVRHDLPGARDELTTLEPGDDPARTEDLAAALYASGDIGAALVVASSIRDRLWRRLAYIGLFFHAHSRKHDDDSARRVVASYTAVDVDKGDPVKRDACLASWHAQLGDTEEAARLFDKATALAKGKKGDDKNAAVELLVKESLYCADFARALTSAKLASPAAQASMRADIAHDAIGRDELDTALAALATMKLNHYTVDGILEQLLAALDRKLRPDFHY